MTATAKKIPSAASDAPSATAEPSPLAALRAEAEPLVARLAQVEAELAAPDPAPPGGEANWLDAAVASRKDAVRKRADLAAERDVILEHLTPLRSRIAQAEAEEQERLKIAHREESLALGREALGRVRAAREALEKEIEAFTTTAQTAPVKFNMLPEMHFEALHEGAEIFRCARSLAA